MVTAISNESRPNVAALIRALEGLRNARAIALLLGAAVTAVLLAAMGMATDSKLIIGLFAIIAFLCLVVGVSAAGGVLMDAARGVPQRSITDAVITGTVDFFKLIVIGILAGLFFAAYFFLLAAILFVCKIPGIGPLLYAVLFPVLVVSSALVVIGLGVGLTIAGPAVWEGNGVGGAAARVMSIAATRLPEVLVGVLLLYLLMFVVIGIVTVIIVSGLSVVGGVSAAILGANITGSVGGLMGGLGSMHGYGLGGDGGGSGYAYAVMFGGSILWAAVTAAVLSVFTMGMNLVYLQASAGLDTGSVEKSLAEGLEQAKHKASELQERAKKGIQEAQERARQAAAERAAAPTSAGDAPAAQDSTITAMKCPDCGARVTPQDAFCGECGHRLR